MQLLFVIFFLEPYSILTLPVRCTKIEFYEGGIYLIQENNRAILRVDSSNSMQNIPVEGGINNRIYGVKLAPFSIYLNMMGGIFKLFLNSGFIENIYKGDVVSFVINDAEEIILMDRLKKEILFLDSRYKIRLIKKNFNVIDMDYFNNRIYLLTRKEIFVLDDYGNIIEKIEIPEKKEKIVVDEKIYLFSSAQKDVLVKGQDWKKIEIGHPIIDLKATEKDIVTLSQYGDAIYIYNKSDF
ncbi:MAG: hypothetical protein ABIL07_02740 [candidate division WOR-3 bacterium]